MSTASDVGRHRANLHIRIGLTTRDNLFFFTTNFLVVILSLDSATSSLSGNNSTSKLGDYPRLEPTLPSSNCSNFAQANGCWFSNRRVVESL